MSAAHNVSRTSRSGVLLISLDFEIRWGVRDLESAESYRPNLLGERRAVPAMLELFSEYGIHVTWATVGFLFFETRKQLLAAMPTKRPAYRNRKLSPYENLHEVGADERDDPYHYAPSLLRLIAATPHQEIGTHTFSHYYCLEEGQTVEAFEADLCAAQKAAEDYGVQLKSLVFPRNQFNARYVEVCRRMGIAAYRGNEVHWVYEATNFKKQGWLRRGLRLADAYMDISGHNCFSPEVARHTFPFNMPSSRFLRAYSRNLHPFNRLRRRRILNGLTHAARHGLIYHLWWHPHNFGVDTDENISFLRSVLEHYAALRDNYGMESLSMGELAQRWLEADAIEEVNG